MNHRRGEGTPSISRGKDRLYRCLDRLLPHKPALAQHLATEGKDLFGATFDRLLYELTSTYFEGDVEAVPQAQRGYARDHRPDCKQLVLALIVNPEGFPLTYEVFPGQALKIFRPFQNHLHKRRT